MAGSQIETIRHDRSSDRDGIVMPLILFAGFSGLLNFVSALFPPARSARGGLKYARNAAARTATRMVRETHR
jgi:hypothetical protein